MWFIHDKRQLLSPCEMRCDHLQQLRMNVGCRRTDFHSEKNIRTCRSLPCRPLPVMTGNRRHVPGLRTVSKNHHSSAAVHARCQRGRAGAAQASGFLHQLAENRHDASGVQILVREASADQAVCQKMRLVTRRPFIVEKCAAVRACGKQFIFTRSYTTAWVKTLCVAAR